MGLESVMSCACGRAPVTRATTCPPTNSDIVGMPSTPWARVVPGLVSTSSDTTRSRPACSRAIRSRTGAIILHGGHQSAVNSTSTGVVLIRTSSTKVRSVVGVRDMAAPRWVLIG